MIRSAVVLLSLLVLTLAATAQERVTVGTTRSIDNGALFLAVAQGYFKAEGLDVDMTAYRSDKEVAEAVASGATDFGLGGFTPDAFNYASRGFMKAVAAQVREKANYEGNEIIASNRAHARGVIKPEDLRLTVVGITALGTNFHYQLGQIARVKKIDFPSMTIKSMRNYDAIGRALGNNEIDVAILPNYYARELLVSSQAKLVGWYSQIDEQQLGALFASKKTLADRREAVIKFVSAYRRAIGDYHEAFLRHDRFSKRISNERTREVATIIARYVFPGQTVGSAAATVEAGAYYMEPQGRLDAADIARQVEWYKSQGLLDANVSSDDIIDADFITTAAKRP